MKDKDRRKPRYRKMVETKIEKARKRGGKRKLLPQKKSNTWKKRHGEKARLEAPLRRL